MEILYILVILSLGFSIGFLMIFFWAVNSNQMSSLDTAPWSILEDDEHKTVNNKDEKQ